MSRGKHVASRPNGRKTRTFGRAVPLALALVMVMSAVAWADSLTVDGDELKAGNDLRYETAATGTARACADRGSAVTGQAEVRRTGGGGTLSASESVTLTLTSPHSEITVSGPHGGVVPSSWTGGASFQIGYTTTVSATVPDGDYVINAKLVGAISGESNALTDSFTVRIACAPSDTTAPTVTLTTDPADPNGNNDWFTTDPVGITVEAVDTESNIESIDCTVDDIPVTLTNTSGIGTSMTASGDFDVTGDGTHSVSCTATDAADNTSTAAALTVKIDATHPTITITTPPNYATYILGEVVNADYECSDATSGLASCVGDVDDGAAIDTSSVGSKTFTVDAEDNAGNQASLTNNYKVVYGVCTLYDQDKAHQPNSTVPIKLFLCDADGNNVSDADVVVQATALKRIETDSSSVEVLEDSGNANPDNNFRYSSDLDDGDGGYIFNLSTKNPSPSLGIKNKLASGQYKLTFKVDGQASSSYAVYFWVR